MQVQSLGQEDPLEEIPTPVFVPGKSHGQRRQVDYSPWGHKRVAYNLAAKQEVDSKELHAGLLAPSPCSVYRLPAGWSVLLKKYSSLNPVTAYLPLVLNMGGLVFYGH